jgi:hypothetical protein
MDVGVSCHPSKIPLEHAKQLLRWLRMVYCRCGAHAVHQDALRQHAIQTLIGKTSMPHGAVTHAAVALSEPLQSTHEVPCHV